MAETIKEVNDERVPELEIITQTMAQLVSTVQTQNDIILVLLHNMKRLGLEMPEWDSLEAINKDISEPIRDCVKAVRKIYGPSKTDKS